MCVCLSVWVCVSEWVCVSVCVCQCVYVPVCVFVWAFIVLSSVSSPILTTHLHFTVLNYIKSSSSHPVLLSPSSHPVLPSPCSPLSLSSSHPVLLSPCLPLPLRLLAAKRLTGLSLMSGSSFTKWGEDDMTWLDYSFYSFEKGTAIYCSLQLLNRSFLHRVGGSYFDIVD